jgi:predicted secreted hydrolase
LLAAAALLGACGGGGEEPGYRLAASGAGAERRPALPPVSLPKDEAPHGDLTEWWYYTGHLYSGGRRYGFEYVVFQAVRGRLPRSYASHFAITDVGRRSFAHDQRSYTGPQPQPAQGFDLRVGSWRMGGLNGSDRLRASMDEYAIDLQLRATKPPVLHDDDGIVSFGPVGDSYYYSRTRMEVSGTLTDRGERLPVTGQAWMDHQWGNFISVAGGGWDWYSVQLEDGSDITLSVVRDLEGRTGLRYGTYVDPQGRAERLAAERFEVRATGSWESPRTGAKYPSGWRLTLPEKGLDVRITPVIADQELDTRETTGVTYWEGSVDVSGTRGGKPARGVGYVELTGYAPTGAAGAGR